MPAVTNLTGSNPGPVLDTKPDITQLPIGDVWKLYVLTMALTPVAVAVNTTAEQTFNQPGIGLLAGDFVWVNKPTAQAGLGVVGVRVSAADTLAITYVNDTAGSLTPTTETYLVFVARPLGSGNQAAITV